ncbi:hypothetical protein HPC49_44085 [Pyxidicoccus fallax]|uniref:Lipoprotein n=1 Tax=Pyxidicoccus fallax TaxID=394095 RepID=A0A848LUA2_9BACT|nr:hypothetical protein [Pyxidicoccus fallax]NMO21231.1 hypothetical protein [Pyxidicoccus fallax]NPC85165.1 hypothetical protein [Pyxidicoccus fallax]
MNRIPSPRFSCFPGSRVWLLVGLLAWAGGCAVEDPVASFNNVDGGSGPQSTGDGGPSEEGAPPDCAPEVPDAGTPCAPVEETAE